MYKPSPESYLVFPPGSCVVNSPSSSSSMNCHCDPGLEKHFKSDLAKSKASAGGQVI